MFISINLEIPMLTTFPVWFTSHLSGCICYITMLHFRIDLIGCCNVVVFRCFFHIWVFHLFGRNRNMLILYIDDVSPRTHKMYMLRYFHRPRFIHCVFKCRFLAIYFKVIQLNSSYTFCSR